MIASLICVVSIAAFFEFLVLYCRSVVASTARVQLSDRVREVAGLGARSVGADDFAHFLQLVRLCPEHDADRTEICFVGAYYSLLNLTGRIFRALAPRIAAWVESERLGCSYFAAVVLDRRMSCSRDLFAHQASGSL